MTKMIRTRVDYYMFGATFVAIFGGSLALFHGIGAGIIGVVTGAGFLFIGNKALWDELHDLRDDHRETEDQLEETQDQRDRY